MDNIQQFNLEPLHKFFNEWIEPSDLAKVFDELLLDYLSLVIKTQIEGSDPENIHEETNRFIFYLKTLRDLLPECEKQ